MAFVSKNTVFVSMFEVLMYEPLYEPDIKSFPVATSVVFSYLTLNPKQTTGLILNWQSVFAW